LNRARNRGAITEVNLFLEEMERLGTISEEDILFLMLWLKDLEPQLGQVWKSIAEAYKNKKNLLVSEEWGLIKSFVAEASRQPTQPTTSTPLRDPWACKYCTFVNTHGGDICEMCGLPHE
jgi:hypothetical protein